MTNSPEFSIYNSSGAQNFVSGKTYVIAAYMKTSLTRAPIFLSDAKELYISPPSGVSAPITLENVSTREATLKFSYNDPQSYFVGGTNKEFQYVLKNTTNGKEIKKDRFKVGIQLVG